MDRRIILLRYDGIINIPEERDNRDVQVIGTLIDKIRLNVVDYQGFHIDYGTQFDRPEDGHHANVPLLRDETFFEVRLTIPEVGDSFFVGDGHNVLKYVADELDFRKYHISNLYAREEEFTKTIIEITVEN
jgi:hypothetical protein